MSLIVSQRFLKAIVSNKVINVTRPYATRFASVSVATDATHQSSLSSSETTDVNRLTNTESVTDPEWIKIAVQQLLQHYDNNVKSGLLRTIHNNTNVSGDAKNSKTKVVSDEDLDKALQSFKYHLNEAKLCVSDCKECENTDEFPKEVAAAESAVQSSVEGFLDLLESLQHARPDQQERFLKIREAAVGEIKNVRCSLNAFKERLSN